MAQLIFGTKRQISFASDAEFFEALGFLCKNSGRTSIHWEHNEDQGAWGSEGRIHCYFDIPVFPNYFNSAFTAGVGRIAHRINCNEYIEYIVANHGIVFGLAQDQVLVLRTVPAAEQINYNRGLLI